MKLIYKLSELNNIATILWDQFGSIKTWAFFGEMGMGKTTLIHKLCEHLNVNDTVTSPTFSIINEYKSRTAGIIYHMDWYRLKGEEEAEKAGVEDCLLSGNLCLIEWPENAQGLLPDNCLHIHIQFIDERTRKLNAVLK